MIYREVAPHPKLRKHIKCFWMLDHDYAHSSHDHEWLWADAHTELIFTSGQRYFRKVSGRTSWLPQSFVIGPFQSELELFSKGRTSLVAARFWPWGFHSLSRIPMTDLRNAVSSCRQALGAEGELIDQGLAGTHDPDAKIAKLSQSLLEVFVGIERPRLLSRPMEIDIIKSRGEIRVNELLQKHGFHARRLQRVFLDEIGVTAKVLSRIVRFNHAKQMIERNPDIDLPTLAYDCGYADQPHFTRTFREMFGITPSDFKERMKGAIRRFRETKPDVVFLQDIQAQPD
jgi:AraC-like DNA-binding protein